MKRLMCLVMVAGGLVACSSDPQPQQQYPQQQYPQQQYPPQQQPYPQQAPPGPYPPAPAPAPYPPAPVPAPAAPAPATTGTPTAIPGIEKRPDGTCWGTPPSLDGTPQQPVQLPACPPGV